MPKARCCAKATAPFPKSTAQAIAMTIGTRQFPSTPMFLVILISFHFSQSRVAASG
jgi:hypothetical protein